MALLTHSPCRNLSPSLNSWDIQILHKAALEEIFTGMLSLGQQYQKSSKEAFLMALLTHSACRNLSPSLNSWDIQILHKAALEEVFAGMLSLGQRYQKSSKEAYLQLLQEGHLLLKGALLLSMDAAQGQSLTMIESIINCRVLFMCVLVCCVLYFVLVKLNSYANAKLFFITFSHAWFCFSMGSFVFEVKKQNCAYKKVMKKRFAFEYEFILKLQAQ